jgi:hypothetical protein
MIPNPLDLLSMLGGVVNAVRPDSGATPGKTVDQTSFAELLDKAKSGEFGSNLDVSIARGVDVELSDEQLARLAVAADQAQARGASNAVVLIDGQALSFDVMSRKVTGVVPIGEAGVYEGYDAIINAGDTTAEPKPGALPLPGQRVTPGNESLLKLLGNQNDHFAQSA